MHLDSGAASFGSVKSLGSGLEPLPLPLLKPVQGRVCSTWTGMSRAPSYRARVHQPGVYQDMPGETNGKRNIRGPRDCDPGAARGGRNGGLEPPGGPCLFREPATVAPPLFGPSPSPVR